MNQIDHSMNIKTTRAETSQTSATANKAENKARDSENTGQQTVAPSTDTVTLTDSATSLQKLQANLALAPEVDAANVAAIKTSIEDGSYQIDYDKIVNNLLAIEQDLL